MKRIQIRTREQLDKRNEKNREKRQNRTEEEKRLDDEKRKERYKNLTKETKEKYNIKNKENYEKRKDDEKVKKQKAAYSKEYKKNNKERLKAYAKNWHDDKLKIDDVYKAKIKTRAMIKEAMRRMNYTKKASATQILGCSFNEFKDYLESKFETWMNWDNYGKYNGTPNYGWDIDHIKPLSKGQTIDEIHELNHYTNLQPLCSKINRDVKKDKINC